MANITFTQACHLARRTGFAALPAQVNSLVSEESLPDAIDNLLNQQSYLSDLPDWHDIAPFPRSRDNDVREQQREARRAMAPIVDLTSLPLPGSVPAPIVERILGHRAPIVRQKLFFETSIAVNIYINIFARSKHRSIDVDNIYVSIVI